MDDLTWKNVTQEKFEVLLAEREKLESHVSHLSREVASTRRIAVKSYEKLRLLENAIRVASLQPSTQKREEALMALLHRIPKTPRKKWGRRT